MCVCILNLIFVLDCHAPGRVAIPIPSDCFSVSELRLDAFSAFALWCAWSDAVPPPVPYNLSLVSTVLLLPLSKVVKNEAVGKMLR